MRSKEQLERQLSELQQRPTDAVTQGRIEYLQIVIKKISQ